MRLIDADALKQKMQKVATEAWKMKLNAPIEKTFNQCIDYIDNTPTVEPKQGWWVYAGVDLDGTWYYQCSECLGEVENKTYPHCPYCLARMERINDE